MTKLRYKMIKEFEDELKNLKESKNQNYLENKK